MTAPRQSSVRTEAVCEPSWHPPCLRPCSSHRFPRRLPRRPPRARPASPRASWSTNSPQDLQTLLTPHTTTLSQDTHTHTHITTTFPQDPKHTHTSAPGSSSPEQKKLQGLNCAERIPAAPLTRSRPVQRHSVHKDWKTHSRTNRTLSFNTATYLAT